MADRHRNSGELPHQPTPTHAASPGGLAVGSNDFLAIMVAQSSLRTDIYRFTSWQEALEAHQLSTVGQDWLANPPDQPTYQRVPAADTTPTATATTRPLQTTDDD